MLTFLKKTKNHEISAIFLLYSIFLSIGFISFKDYGISVDEWELREHGFSYLIYICEIFCKETAANIKNIENFPKLSDYFGTHGPIFNVSTAFIEYFFNISDSRNYYLMRHYSNNLIFIIGNFYFYLLVKQRFNNWRYGIIGAIFLFCSPRIFAESFYNHKDIVFLSLFIISLYYGILFYKNPNYKNIILFSFTSALAIDIRIMGIVLIPVIFFFSYFNNNESNKKIIFKISTSLLLLFLFIILFWPYLWNDPFTNFYKVLKTLSSFGHEGYNFYLGKYHLSSNPPWHYTLIWIFITTPILYLFLFLYGFIICSIKIFNNIKNYVNNNTFKEIFSVKSSGEDFIYYILFVTPILTVIVLNSTLYTGWRHLFFVYPCFLIISIKGIFDIKNRYFKNREKYLNILLIFLVGQISFNMIRSHPHQNVYFNLLIGNKAENLFELDYWGLSNKQAFEYILKTDKSSLVKIGSASSISLKNSKAILEYKNRERILITENQNADYIIDNYINWYKYKKRRHEIPNNFEIFKEIKISGNRILSIYKNDN